jgi:nucleotide-binding universal stress UspA family protein
MPHSMSLKKLLCPIDFSSGSQRALRVAARMASELGAELVLVHAWNLPSRPFAEQNPIPEETVRRLVDEEQRQLLAAVTETAELGVPRTTSRLLHGVPWDQIVQAVRDDPAIDLIVMGTHGRTGLARVFLGSVTEQVVRHSPCSVLVTRDPVGLAAFENVLCAIDFSEDSSQVIQRAAELATRGLRAITLLHVIEPPATFSGWRLPATQLADFQQQAAVELERRASELAKKVSVPVTTQIRVGGPAAQILEALDAEPRSNLVLMGSHGRTGIKRVLVGSVAETVLRHAACPVLIVRAQK